MAVSLFTENDYTMFEDASESLKGYGENVRRWLEAGTTQPEYCFVNQTNGKINAGVCFNDEFEVSELVIMDFAIADHSFNEAANILKECIALAQKPKYNVISYNLYDDSPQYRKILRVFLDAGFRIRQQKKCFTFEGGAIPECDGQLSYRMFSQVGEASFIEAVMRVTVDTLDTDMAKDASEQGELQAAKSYVESLKQIDYNESWWQLAYFDNELAGLIIPQRLDENIGAVNYIGVVPEMRGRGYVNELLNNVTRILTDAGFTRIYADIDSGNFPLEAALLRGGYHFKCEESVLTQRSKSIY